MSPHNKVQSHAFQPEQALETMAKTTPVHSRFNLTMEAGSPLRILLQNFVFCTAIALFLWLMVPSVGQYGFFTNFVHSQAIGNSITLLAIASTRFGPTFGFSDRWARIAYHIVVTPVGILIGFWIAGTALGLRRGPFEFLYDADHLLITSVIAIIASFAFNWHLSKREQLTRLQLVAAEERHRADQARHAMLRAQLEPHMLFNTLANLRALISSDTERAVEMLDRLDSFLRATLKSSQSSTHSVQHEFDILQDYLTLMQIRLGERLTYSLVVAADCSGIQVPALILQPLVENAIRHGIEPQIEGGKIDVSAQIDKGRLVLTVTDTGVGLDPVTTTPSAGGSAEDADNPASGNGFGLDNLRERLAQSFAGKAELDLQSQPSQGTRVTVRLPLHQTG